MWQGGARVLNWLPIFTKSSCGMLHYLCSPVRQSRSRIIQAKTKLGRRRSTAPQLGAVSDGSKS
jgi:hypothetical protein